MIYICEVTSRTMGVVDPEYSDIFCIPPRAGNEAEKVEEKVGNSPEEGLCTGQDRCRAQGGFLSAVVRSSPTDPSVCGTVSNQESSLPVGGEGLQ